MPAILLILMRNPKRRLIWAILLIVVLAGVAVGCVIWNKPHKKAENQESFLVNADKLYTDYNSDEKRADSIYISKDKDNKKVLEVSGTATEVSTNQDGQTVVLIGVDDPLGGIQCTLRDKGKVVAKDSQVRIKGFCNGFTSVVILSDCVLVP